MESFCLRWFLGGCIFSVSIAEAVEPRVVQQIDRIQIQYQLSEPPNMIVKAQGFVSSSEFTDVKLVRATYLIPPSDGIQDYFLMATPPEAPSSNVVTLVSASDIYSQVTVAAPWLKGVRVHGVDGGIKTRMLGNSLGVRKNILNLTANEIATFERGVKVLKERPITDPKSWGFQANIHWENTPQNNTLWNQCEHGTLHFFTWHRAYLLRFENILREASGDDSFTLPYWDWSTSPSLPSAFRNSMSPLFDGTRSINGGQAINLTNINADLQFCLSRIPFSSFSNQLDASPHGAVHVQVGGNMGSIPTSAKDPVFWLHHSNVDRIWEQWLSQGGGRQNPSDVNFLNRQFQLVGTNGAVVTSKAGDMLSTSKLGYRYDNVSVTEGLEMESVPNIEFAVLEGKESEKNSILVASSVLKQSVEGTPIMAKLGLETHRIELNSEGGSLESMKSAVASLSPSSKERVKLEFHGLKAKKAPRFGYSVYINLPESENREDIRRLYRVRSLNLFGVDGHGEEPHPSHHAHEKPSAAHGHSSTAKPQVLDASETIARLREAGLWKEGAISIVLIPDTPNPIKGEDPELSKLLEDSAKESGLTYDRIDVKIVSDESE